MLLLGRNDIFITLVLRISRVLDGYSQYVEFCELNPALHLYLPL